MAMGFVLLVVLNAKLAVASVAVGPQNPWMDPTRAAEYADNLLSWYNTLVAMNPARAGPASTLYHSQGHSFSVIVVKAYTPSGESLACFLFTPIEGNEPKVSVVSNMTMLQVLPNLVYTDNMTVVSPRVTVNGTSLTISLIWATLASNVFMDTQANSENAAEQLFLRTRVEPSRPPWYDSLANLAQKYLAYLIFGICGIIAAIVFLRGSWNRRVRVDHSSRCIKVGLIGGGQNIPPCGRWYSASIARCLVVRCENRAPGF
jgi:hypothetical protein